MRASLIALLFLMPLTCGAETIIGIHQPFYIDSDLEGGDVGGYGIHLEYEQSNWFAAYDRLQDVRRREGGHVENQDFITGGYRHTFNNGFQLQAGFALNERSDVLGSPVSFNLGIGYEFKRIRITWQHWSNANTNDINHGFDALTISWRFE